MDAARLAALCRACDPRVPALARRLGRAGDGLLEAAACAWIASKFEDVDALEARAVLRAAGLPAGGLWALRHAEARVLARAGWRLRVRLLPYDAAWEAGCAPALLACLAHAPPALAAAAPARAWARELRRFHQGGASTLVCVLMCAAWGVPALRDRVRSGLPTGT